MRGSVPAEQFPEIGTVENSAVFYDGENIFLCYQIAPVAGGGIAILKFADVIDFRISPMSVEGLDLVVLESLLNLLVILPQQPQRVEIASIALLVWSMVITQSLHQRLVSVSTLPTLM